MATTHDLFARGEGPTAEIVPENFDESAEAAHSDLMTWPHSPWPLFCNELGSS